MYDVRAQMSSPLQSGARNAERLVAVADGSRREPPSHRPNPAPPSTAQARERRRPAGDPEYHRHPAGASRSRPSTHLSHPMPSESKITVVVSRFGDVFAAGLGVLLSTDESIEVVATDIEHDRMPVVLSAHHPDVAILDADALEQPAQLRRLFARNPHTRLGPVCTGRGCVRFRAPARVRCKRVSGQECTIAGCPQRHTPSRARTPGGPESRPPQFRARCGFTPPPDST